MKIHASKRNIYIYYSFSCFFVCLFFCFISDRSYFKLLECITLCYSCPIQAKWIHKALFQQIRVILFLSLTYCMWRHIKIKRKYIYIPIIVAILYSVQTYCTCVCVIWNVNVNQYGAMISRHKLKRKRRKRKKKKKANRLCHKNSHILCSSPNTTSDVLLPTWIGLSPLRYYWGFLSRGADCVVSLSEILRIQMSVWIWRKTSDYYYYYCRRGGKKTKFTPRQTKDWWFLFKHLLLMIVVQHSVVKARLLGVTSLQAFFLDVKDVTY